jgi:hypothetical protein
MLSSAVYITRFAAATAAAAACCVQCYTGYTFVRPEKEQQVLTGVADKLTVMARRWDKACGYMSTSVALCQLVPYCLLSSAYLVSDNIWRTSS